jgi:PEP-CTERM motif
MKFPRIFLALVVFAGGSCALDAQTSINVGGVALNTNTGYYLNYDGSFCTNGIVLFGSFNLTEAQLKALIAAWGTSEQPTYAEYTNLLSHFTEVGTGGANGSSVPGWNFSTNGTIAGTSTNVSLSVFPAGTEMYAWTFNITNVGIGITNNASSFKVGTEWGLYTAGTNPTAGWLLPSLGSKSLALSQVLTSGTGDYLIGSAAISNSTVGSYSVEMVRATTVPEPSSAMLLGIGALLGAFLIKRRALS